MADFLWFLGYPYEDEMKTFHGWFWAQSMWDVQAWFIKVVLTSKIADNGCFWIQIFAKMADFSKIWLKNV